MRGEGGSIGWEMGIPPLSLPAAAASDDINSMRDVRLGLEEIEEEGRVPAAKERGEERKEKYSFF